MVLKILPIMFALPPKIHFAVEAEVVVKWLELAFWEPVYCW